MKFTSTSACKMRSFYTRIIFKLLVSNSFLYLHHYLIHHGYRVKLVSLVYWDLLSASIYLYIIKPERLTHSLTSIIMSHFLMSDPNQPYKWIKSIDIKIFSKMVTVKDGGSLSHWYFAYNLSFNYAFRWILVLTKVFSRSVTKWTLTFECVLFSCTTLVLFFFFATAVKRIE